MDGTIGDISEYITDITNHIPLDGIHQAGHDTHILRTEYGPDLQDTTGNSLPILLHYEEYIPVRN
jgi:hypothetical protein